MQHKRHLQGGARTWRRCPESRRRCWSRWSPCCPRSWCRRPGCLGTRRTPSKRWSGKPPWSRTDLKTQGETHTESSLSLALVCLLRGRTRSTCTCLRRFVRRRLSRRVPFRIADPRQGGARSIRFNYGDDEAIKRESIRAG